MHMADALISPAVGGAMWAATAGVAAFSAKKVQQDPDERKIPLMGVMGAFIFAAEMINFAIPGTGSSGHFGGGLLLAILLGPHAAFLTMISILTVQALFFGDGGLLALGCNIFNLAFFTSFIAYPLIYKQIAGKKMNQNRIFWGAMLAAVTGLQLGSLGVVLETLVSGNSALPFKTFVLLMQPIHLAIGIVEGLVTAAVVSFIRKARPELLENAVLVKPLGGVSLKKVLTGLGMAAVLTGGALSWFASSRPDGLEWSVFHASGKEQLEAGDKIHHLTAMLQKKTAFFPGYEFKKSSQKTVIENQTTSTWPDVKGGTTVAGLAGGVITLLLAVIIGAVLRFIKNASPQ